MKEISALDLRKRFGDIMDQVRYGKEPWVVTKNGRPMMVLVDVAVFRAVQEQSEEAAFIEQYSQERIREFLEEDKIDPQAAREVKRRLAA